MFVSFVSLFAVLLFLFVVFPAFQAFQLFSFPAFCIFRRTVVLLQLLLLPVATGAGVAGIVVFLASKAATALIAKGTFVSLLAWLLACMHPPFFDVAAFHGKTTVSPALSASCEPLLFHGRLDAMDDTAGWICTFTNLLRHNGHILAFGPTGSEDMRPGLALTETALSRCMLHSAFVGVRVTGPRRRSILDTALLPHPFSTAFPEYDSCVLLHAATVALGRTLLSPQQWHDIVTSVITAIQVTHLPATPLPLAVAGQTHSAASGGAMRSTHEHADDAPYSSTACTDLYDLSHEELVGDPATHVDGS